jgi:hypothetical protein
VLAKINHKVVQHKGPLVLSIEIPSSYRIGWTAKSTVGRQGQGLGMKSG